jgi:hypothetical protein
LIAFAGNSPNGAADAGDPKESSSTAPARLATLWFCNVVVPLGA